MKTIKLILILLTITIVGCDNNDDEQTDLLNPSDGFTHNTVFFETSNAYFEIDDGDNNPADGYPDNYNFFFSNGRMFDNDNNVNGSSAEYLLSRNTSSWVFLNIEVSDNPSLSNAGPSAGNTYIASRGDSVIVENAQIDPLSTPYFNNNIEFGSGNENIGIFNIPGTTLPSITINSIDLDANNPAESTIDVDYTFMNQMGDIIEGHYEGTFGVILD